MTAQPVIRPRRRNRPVPYALTAAGLAALAADPANDLRHEPRGGRTPCNGQGCRCTFPGTRRRGEPA